MLDKVDRVYAKPPYSPFPRAEYEDRVRRLKEEMVKAVDMGEYYRIPTDTRDLNYNKFFEEGEEVISQAGEYHSHNTHRLDEDELTNLLLGLREIQDDLEGFGTCE